MLTGRGFYFRTIQNNDSSFWRNVKKILLLTKHTHYEVVVLSQGFHDCHDFKTKIEQ